VPCRNSILAQAEIGATFTYSQTSRCWHGGIRYPLHNCTHGDIVLYYYRITMWRKCVAHVGPASWLRQANLSMHRGVLKPIISSSLHVVPEGDKCKCGYCGLVKWWILVMKSVQPNASDRLRSQPNRVWMILPETLYSDSRHVGLS
jgi:hypothetical protein